ncbi:MAG: glycosyltransferase family 2 protein [Bacteroidales bacterium]|nr:glycosyltransferase family 2 protein [Bacteroidales bacterium]
MERIAVLIPCLNEEITVARVVEDFRAQLPDAGIYVYDNGSTDRTAEMASKAGATVLHEPRRGKGNVIRRMLHDIDALCYIIVDGDDTYPAEHAREMADCILEQGYDMAIGDRISSQAYGAQNKRRFHGFGNKLVCRLINTVYRGDLRDIMTGYRAIGYAFAKSFPVLSQGFEIETEMSIHCLDRNLLYRNFPIEYRNRPEGSISKLRTYGNGLQVLYTIFTLYRTYKPLRFFLWCSAISLAISISFLVPVLMEFMATNTTQKLPSFIACVFFAIFSILSFFQGLSLDTINQKERRDFEIQYGSCRERVRNAC